MTRPLVLKVDEASFQAAVTDLATATGWRWCHFRPGRVQGGGWRTPIAGSPGWPDLVLVRGDRALFVELKSTDGRPRVAGRPADHGDVRSLPRSLRVRGPPAVPNATASGPAR